MSEKKGKGSKMKKLLLGFVSIIVSIVVAAMSAAYIAEFKNIMDDIINSGELESIVQDAVDSSIDDLETMEPDEQKYVSGVWLLNNELTRPEVNAPLEQVVNVKLEWSLHTVNVSKFIIYDSAYEYGSNYDVVISTESDDSDLDQQSGYLYMTSDGGWCGSFESRFWDFGDTPQAVSEEFYNWLIANAVQEGYVSGVWTFNDTLPLFENGDSIEYDIAFTSNGKSYMCINCYNTPGPVGDVTMNYYVEKTGFVGPDFDNAYDSGWANDDYRLVDFGSIPQFVSEEFYTWLTANATQQ